MRRTKCGGWPYSQPPNVPFEINRASSQSEGLALWMPWGGGVPGTHRHIDRVCDLEFAEGGTPVWTADGERGWSMLFDDGASEYLEVDQAPVFDVPLTLFCKCRSDTSVASQALMWVGNKDVTNRFVGMRIHWSAARVLQAIAVGTSWRLAQATANWSTNTWHSACGVFPDDNNRHAYLDGANKGSIVGAATLQDFDRMSLGRFGSSSPGSYLSGSLGDVRVYNVAKTDAEAYQMHAEPWELWKPQVRWWTGWRSPITVRVPRYGFTSFQVPGIV